MPFGRTGKLNNRSQHALVESAGPAAVAPTSNITPSGASGPSNSSSASPLDSFVDHRSANQQPPSPHIFAQGDSGLAAITHQQQQQQQQQQQIQALGTGPNSPYSPDSARVRKAAQDFAEAVQRSQSQKYHQVTTPIQPNPSYGASSFENLSATLQQIPQGQTIAYAQHSQQAHPAQQAPPIESKRSTRRLIKNILSGAPSLSRADHGNPQSQFPYDNTAGLARRPSKRVSNPPTIRTGPSQVSLDQQPHDWQAQSSHTQPSPLQSAGDVKDLYSSNDSHRQLLLQNPHDIQHPTLRRVPTNQDSSPCSDDGSFQIHSQSQVTPDQPQQLGQVTFDPATQQYQFIAHSLPGQYHDESHQVYSGHLVANPLQNPETISQLSHDSPTADVDQPHSSQVQSTATSPAIKHSTQAQEFSLRTASLPQVPQEQNMPPQPGGPAPPRRSQEAEKSLRGQIDPPPGPPPSYRHSQQPSSNMNNLPAASSGAAGTNPPNYRQSTIPDRQQFEGTGEQGRNSPQPSEDPEKAFKDLLTKYKNVKRLYFDGKSHIDQLTGQVEQLQNAVANQRISQSRTSLDDNEYTTRFNRLNGAINNLSFNIRKDWMSLPQWLDKYVSTDAVKTGKQEMTAIGRAVITRWIVDEIFYSCFHPGLDPELSRQLKEIELNIRKFSYTMNSQEEHDALTAKVVSWRMTTLEGLQRVLNSPESANNRQDFTRRATKNLTATLFQHLADPPPAGVDGSASMIVELAVGIASNLPLESRDVALIYPLPQDPIQTNLMEVEKAGLPAIETRPPDSEGDADSRTEESGKDSGGGGEKGGSKERSKSRSALPPKDSNKVRFAGFLAVEVRGRQVLVKAPVWTLG